jgi:hypothetical protein
MKEIEAQIKILEFVLDNVCDCEMNIRGRLFIRDTIKRLKKKLDDTSNPEKQITNPNRN